MKKRTLSVLFVLILAFSLLTGCKNETPKMYTVTVYSLDKAYPHTLLSTQYPVVNGFIEIRKIKVEDGVVIGALDLKSFYNADKYRFCGWYTDESYSSQWNLYKDEVRCNLSLYAKLERI